MHWERRRDLEGGKELGVWLLAADDGSVERELYVESHEYRGGNFDVYTTSEDASNGGDEWTHEGEFETVDEAFDAALDILDESEYPVEGR